MIRTVIATGNLHKVQEFEEILAPYGLELITPKSLGGLPEVDETGDTFEANAILKAESACAHSGLWAIADDSGIEAAALVEPTSSARYAGIPCDDLANNAKLCEELRPHADKRVRYVCAMLSLVTVNKPSPGGGLLLAHLLKNRREKAALATTPTSGSKTAAHRGANAKAMKNTVVPTAARFCVNASLGCKHSRCSKAQACALTCCAVF